MQKSYDPATNFAPVKPLVEARDTDTPSKGWIHDALREKYKDKMSERKTTWRSMLGVGQMIALFMEGKQKLVYNPFSKSYAPVEVKTNHADYLGPMNVFQFYATKHDQQWLGSNPNIRIVAQGDDERMLSAAKGADIMLEHYERKFYTVPFSRAESKLVQCFGTNINRVRFDPYKKGGKILREITEEREIELGEGFGECECGATGTAKEFGEAEIAPGVSMPQCQQCGSLAVMVEPPPREIVPMVVGKEQVPYGDIICEVVPLPASRWDIRYPIEESSWAIIETMTNLGAVHLSLGKIKLKEKDKENPGLEIMDALVGMGSGVDSSSASGLRAVRDGRAQHEVVSTEMFLSAEDLWDIKPGQDEKTVSGHVFKKDVRLSEVFPDGACICALNGMELITGIYPESHKEQLTSGAYHAKPLSGTGRGLEDMLEPQKRLNKSDAQIYDYHQSIATPAILHAKGAIKMDEARYLGHPKANIAVNLQHFPNIKDLGQLVRPLEGRSAGQLMYQYAYTTLNNFMQLQSHVTEFSGGLPGVDNETATGAKITAALGQSMFAPLLSGKISTRLGNGKNIVKIFTKNFPYPKFFASHFRGKNRLSKGQWLAGADVEGDFEYEVEQDSEIARNSYTKQQQLIEVFAGVFGGYQNYLAAKQTDPEGVNAIMRQYNLDLETDTDDEIGEICRGRLDSAMKLADVAMKQLSQMYGEMGAQYFVADALLDGIDNPIEPFELQQDVQLKWYADYFHTDEGLSLAPHQRAIINAFITRHFIYQQNQQSMLAEAAAQVELAGQAPMMQAQADAQMQQGKQQLQLAGAQNEMANEQAQTELENQADAEIIKTGGQMIRDKAKLATDQQRQQMKNAQ